jgi:hypothetical protein
MSSCAPTWESAWEWNCCLRAEVLKQGLAQAVVAGEQVAPGLVAQCAAFHGLTGDVIAPHGRDDHDVLATHGRGEFGHLAGRFPSGFPLVQAAVERGEHSAGGDLEIALLQFLGQARRIVGEVAVGAKFDPLVAGFGYFVEETFPGGLLRIVREPDAPGVWCRADDQLVLSHDCIVFLGG